MVAVVPAPAREGRAGRRVTGVFRFSRGLVYHLWVGGEPTPIRVTERHPFWSVDRRDWVAAGDLRNGERLQAAGGTAVVLGFEFAGCEPVYNIEVDADHCYRVGQLGLLVHNASCPDKNEFKVLQKDQRTFRWTTRNPVTRIIKVSATVVKRSEVRTTIPDP